MFGTVWNLTCPTSKCSFENSPKKNRGNEVCLSYETGVPFETWKRNVCFLCSHKLQGAKNDKKHGLESGKSSSKYVAGRGYVSSQQSILTTCKLINTRTYRTSSQWKNNLAGGCCFGKKNQQVLFKPWIYGYMFLFFL